MEDPVVFRDVEVIRRTDLILMCRLGDRTVPVPPLRILEGTTVRTEGDRGTLVLPRDLAVDLGLL